MKIVILGAGIAGLGCAHYLKTNSQDSTIFEKRSSWGGLCDNFEIEGFRFDRFIHLSFSKSDYVNNIFLKQLHYKHKPLSYNYADGFWIKHPVQNNLYPLPQIEKNKIIESFKNRSSISENNTMDYEQWLRAHYGDYFTEKFPLRYTNKYWTVPAKDLGVEWVGKRMSQPSLQEVIYGAENQETANAYYAEEMRYPKKGGYKSFLTELKEKAEVRLNKNLVEINPALKQIFFEDGSSEHYEILVSSLPLPEIIKALKNAPRDVKQAAERLQYTSAYLVSLGFNRPDIAKHLWFYIYDEDILPTRVYSPSLKSPDNAPSGCSSLQAEIYFSKRKPIELSKELILEKTISDLSSMGMYSINDLAVSDIRKEEYANVIFTKDIYENRDKIRAYLNSINIYSIGRYGEWDYFWSDQSLLSGCKAAENILKTINLA